MRASSAILSVLLLVSARTLALPHANTLVKVSRSDANPPLKGVDTPTGNPANCTYPTRYFRQLVHHPKKDGDYLSTGDDSSKADTFLQQYQIITDYFKPGGPILFYQGAEGPLSCLEYQAYLQYAMELGGIAVTLEHRFFGLSIPAANLSYENNLEWPTSALSSLTVDNVLLDSVEFLEWVRSSVPGAKRSKIVGFGGSYAALISAMERLHYPETFFAAFPTAGPFRGLISDPKDPLTYGWGNWLQQALLDASPMASWKIEKALKDFRNRLASGNFENMKDELNLCTQPNNTSQADMLYEKIVGAYSSAAQYSFSATGLSFNSLINGTLLAGAGTFEVLDVALQLLLADQQAECLDWDSSGRRSTQPLPFMWMICTYVPYPEDVYRLDDSILGPHHPDSSLKRLNDEKCQRAFGMDSVDGGVEFQRSLGIDQESLEGSTRMFLTHGTHDPTTALAPKVFWGRDNRQQSRMFIMTGGAHGDDAFFPVPLDSVAKNETKLAQLNTMKEWLGLHGLPEEYPSFKSMNDSDILPLDATILAA